MGLLNSPVATARFTITPVSRTGSGSLSGVLNDGTKFTARAPVAQPGLWPLYVSLSKNTSACIGWVSLAKNTPVLATVDWFAPGSNGTDTTTLRVEGSQYTTGPELSDRWDVTLSGGGLPSKTGGQRWLDSLLVFSPVPPTPG